MKTGTIHSANIERANIALRPAEKLRFIPVFPSQRIFADYERHDVHTRDSSIQEIARKQCREVSANIYGLFDTVNVNAFAI